MKKQYECKVCGKIYKEDKHPVRWNICEYGIGRYNQYYPVKHIDLCIGCSNEILRIIKEKRYEIQSRR